jgi:hypothetical protein
MSWQDNTPSFSDDPIPPIFGSKAHTKVAVMLACYGPTPVRCLARVLGVDSESVFRWVALLTRSGMIEKRAVGAAYPGLNRAYRLHDNVRGLLLAIAERHPQPDPHVPKWREGFSTTSMQKSRGLGTEVEWLFGRRNRSRVLMLVGAAGMINEQETANNLQLDVWSTRYAINRLVGEKLLAKRGDGQHRMLTINPEMAGADEFKRLLRCIATYRRDVRGCAQLARTAMGYRKDRNPLTAAAGADTTTSRYRGRASRQVGAVCCE